VKRRVIASEAKQSHIIAQTIGIASSQAPRNNKNAEVLL